MSTHIINKHTLYGYGITASAVAYGHAPSGCSSAIPLCANMMSHIKRSTKCIATPSGQDRATDLCIKNLVKIGCLIPEICLQTDKHADRQTVTVITILHFPISRG